MVTYLTSLHIGVTRFIDTIVVRSITSIAPWLISRKVRPVILQYSERPNIKRSARSPPTKKARMVACYTIICL